jgi:hypothetical protein
MKGSVKDNVLQVSMKFGLQQHQAIHGDGS